MKSKLFSKYEQFQRRQNRAYIRGRNTGAEEKD